MHVDSQRDTSGDSKNSAAAEQLLGRFGSFGLGSSRDPTANSASVPFTDRMRAGMVINWDAPARLQYGPAGSMNLAVILCPATAFGSSPAHTISGTDSTEEEDPLGSDAFLCALVSPGVIPDSYTVDLWRQVVVKKSQMKAEVILEYDSATRYYHINI